MALPVIAASLVGGIVAGLTQFFSKRIGMILVGLGLTFTMVKGFEILIGYIVSDFTQMVAYVQSAGGGSGGGSAAGLGAVMIQFAAYAGLFDALNILISGWMAFASLSSLSFTLKRLNK
ncbi:MAG: hypothetical protein CGU28_02165 [Candidatus Dactylopiibacterium carminicum]|uniref:DUF2523 domain-containing protein n=1 Tax=Candidatus Dactylopiibacterium carminicum TaxID=857335 RepID=A0A272EVD6_9RHOO|nr:DUF2523 family protein [Candidatus Dactylopiibacterium carminicum]KAF7600091.1 DUF2523 domain-containing protein [Candidatus Dactylopiibacterium carminicum]PAS94079.1 MAG: hypothetical protein CGU29_05410 [Candidatus Dactylopiibacterium carminicum]PAS98158.1 MAG: hypothetical protein CGU28_02165 [Candidatus Dactylopiibacterium carminicum]PAT00093.1 MAG: hypothetical protein BSR46_04175 [Candidatus Dactylopiibacterium carminicum]